MLILPREKRCDMRVVTNQIELEPEEIAALDESHKIVAERAVKEEGKYDDEMLEWWLLGMLNTGITAEEMLEWARTAPFQSDRKRHIR